jgi:hypothetical protein
MQFDQIAADIRSIPDATAQAEAALEIFGTKGNAGTALLPMIRQLPELRAQAKALAVTMSTEDANAGEELSSAFGALKAEGVALAAAVGAAIAGPLRDFLVWSEKVTAFVIEWIHNNPELVRGIAAVAGVIAIAATAMSAFAVASVIAEAVISKTAAIGAIAAGAAAGYAIHRLSSGASAGASPAAGAVPSGAFSGPDNSGNPVLDRLDTLISVTRTNGLSGGIG